MKVSIMQPNIFMWGGLLKSIIDSDLHIVLDIVSSSKNSRYNRNKIEGVGEPTWLTIPFIDFKRSKKIMFQKLDTSKETISKIKNIYTNRYSDAEYFENGLKVISSTLYSDTSQTNLNDIYINFLNALRSLEIPLCKIIFASSILGNAKDQDYPKGIDLVNLLLKKVNAKTYLTSENTVKYSHFSDYVTKEVFIQKFNSTFYKQSELKNTAFTPNLSCLDYISYLNIAELINNLNKSNKWEKIKN